MISYLRSRVYIRQFSIAKVQKKVLSADAREKNPALSARLTVQIANFHRYLVAS